MATKTLQRPCPRCRTFILNDDIVRNALSRRDNKTYICSACGADEAMFDFRMSQKKKLSLRIQTEIQNDCAVERAWLKEE